MYEIYGICKGGGYKYCRTIPPHPKRNSKNLYPLHRVLMENKLGRSLGPNEVVHHLDGNKNNNDPENLVALTHEAHGRLHAVEKAPPFVKCVCACGRPFSLRPNFYRARMRRAASGRIYCSRSCGTIYSSAWRGRTVQTRPS